MISIKFCEKLGMAEGKNWSDFCGKAGVFWISEWFEGFFSSTVGNRAQTDNLQHISASYDRTVVKFSQGWKVAQV